MVGSYILQQFIWNDVTRGKLYLQPRPWEECVPCLAEMTATHSPGLQAQQCSSYRAALGYPQSQCANSALAKHREEGLQNCFLILEKPNVKSQPWLSPTILRFLTALFRRTECVCVHSNSYSRTFVMSMTSSHVQSHFCNQPHTLQSWDCQLHLHIVIIPTSMNINNIVVRSMWQYV